MAFITPPLVSSCRAVDAIDGDTPLHVAARDQDVSGLSLVYAADPSAAGVRNARGQLPIHVMIKHRHEASFWEALGGGKTPGHQRYVPWERDEDVVSPDAGRNPLVTAIDVGNWPAAKYMVTCEWPAGRCYQTPARQSQRARCDAQRRLCKGVRTPGAVQRRALRSANQQQRRLSQFPDLHQKNTPLQQYPGLIPVHTPRTQQQHTGLIQQRYPGLIPLPTPHTQRQPLGRIPVQIPLTQQQHPGLCPSRITDPRIHAVQQPESMRAVLEELDPGVVKDFMVVTFPPREDKDGWTVIDEREGKREALFAACRIGHWDHVRYTVDMGKLSAGQSMLHVALTHLPKDRVGTEQIRLLLSPPVHVQGMTCPVRESQMTLLGQLGYNLYTVLGLAAHRGEADFKLFQQVHRAGQWVRPSSMEEDKEYQLAHRLAQEYKTTPLTLKQLAVNATRRSLPCVRPEAIEGLKLPQVIKQLLMLTGMVQDTGEKVKKALYDLMMRF